MPTSPAFGIDANAGGLNARTAATATQLQPPEAWADACAGNVPCDTQSRIGRAIVEGLAGVIPSVACTSPICVDAGVVCAWGATDISDPHSMLHRRHDIGVHAHDGYFSIDTGKFTCAPAFAQDLLRALK